MKMIFNGKYEKKTQMEFIQGIIKDARDDAERYVAAVMEQYDDLENVNRLFRRLFESWLQNGRDGSYVLYRYTAENCGMLLKRFVKMLAEAEDSIFYDVYFAEFMVGVYTQYAGALNDIGLSEEQIQQKIMEAMPDGKYGICGFDIPK